MAICLYPFLVGVPHRAKHFAEALKYIASRREVWLATGNKILDAYKKQNFAWLAIFAGFDGEIELGSLFRTKHKKIYLE